MRAFVFGEKVGEFVEEDGGAARFKNDDGGRGFDFREKLVHDLEEQRLGAVEQAGVVERAAAAQVGARNENIEPGGFEHFGGSFGGCGEEGVIESVGPEKHGTSRASPRRTAEASVPTPVVPLPPLLKCFRR